MTKGHLAVSQMMLFLSHITTYSARSFSAIEHSSKTRLDDNSDCFHFIYKRLTWREASDFCATELSSDLLLIPDSSMINKLILEKPGGAMYDVPKNHLKSKYKLCLMNITLDNIDPTKLNQIDKKSVWEDLKPQGFIRDPMGDGLCYLLQQQQPHRNYLSMYMNADFPFVCKYSRKMPKLDGFDNSLIATNLIKNNCWREKEREYIIYPTPTDWLSAEKICLYNSGHLVELHDHNTNSILMDMLSSLNISSIWIGLNFTSDGWRWSDDVSAAYWHFPRGRDDTSNDEPLCVELITKGFYEESDHVKEGSWNITSCDFPHPFVCQRVSKSLINEGIISQSGDWKSIGIGVIVFTVLLMGSCVYVVQKRELIVIPLLTKAFWHGKWLIFIGYQKAENGEDMNDPLKCENSEFSIE